MDLMPEMVSPLVSQHQMPKFRIKHGQCRTGMSGVPPGRECSGTSRGVSAHAGISEMETSEVRPCRENGNYLKWVAN